MTTYFLLSLCSLLASPSSNTFAHDFHISRTQIEYNQERQEWQLSLFVFIDDLELALKGDSPTKLRLGMQRESVDADTYIDAYINSYLKLRDLEENPLSYRFLGKEMTEDLSSFWIYFYVENAPTPNGIHIENRLFTHLYEDQQNEVLIIGPKQENKQIIFNKDYWKERVLFSKK